MVLVDMLSMVMTHVKASGESGMMMMIWAKGAATVLLYGAHCESGKMILKMRRASEIIYQWVPFSTQISTFWDTGTGRHQHAERRLTST